MRRYARKSALCAVFLLWLLAVLPIEAEVLKKVNFMPMWLPQPQFAGFYMAKEKGIYAKYGLDVTILDRGYDESVLNALKQGKVDFGVMNLLTAIEKKAAGEEILNVGQIFQKSTIEFVARKGSGIKTPQDFNGKKIALWRTVLRDQTQGFLTVQNIQGELYFVEEVESFFLKGAVDVISVMHYNEYHNLINHGMNPEELMRFPLKDFDMNFPEDGIYCLASTCRSDPDLARQFVRASLEGWAYALANPEETLAVISKIRLKKNLITNQSHLRWMMAAMPEMLHPEDSADLEGRLLKSDFDRAVDFLLRTQRISHKVRYDAFFASQ